MFFHENYRFINSIDGLITLNEGNKKTKENINELMNYNRIVLESYGTTRCVGKFQRLSLTELCLFLFN